MQGYSFSNFQYLFNIQSKGAIPRQQLFENLKAPELCLKYIILFYNMENYLQNIFTLITGLLNFKTCDEWCTPKMVI